MEDAEAVFDGKARGDDEEAGCEEFGLRVLHGVDGLPGDEHGHDGGFACAGGEFEGDAIEAGVGFGVGVGEVGEDTFGGGALGGNFGQPDGGFGGFDLAEKGPQIGELVVTPVLEEAGGGRGDAPLFGIGESAPGVDLGADFADVGRGVAGGGGGFIGSEVEAGLDGRFATGGFFARLGDGGDVADVATLIDFLLSWLALVV